MPAPAIRAVRRTKDQFSIFARLSRLSRTGSASTSISMILHTESRPRHRSRECDQYQPTVGRQHPAVTQHAKSSAEVDT
jgi:hypothetical protein